MLCSHVTDWFYAIGVNLCCGAEKMVLLHAEPERGILSVRCVCVEENVECIFYKERRNWSCRWH